MTPSIIYHRGRHGVLDGDIVLHENSLPAFEQAISEHAEIIEFDVWDGMKIAHDPLGESSLRVKDAIELIAGRCTVNIEIKSPAIARELVEYLKDVLRGTEWQADQIVLSAFHHPTAILCKELLPEVRVAIVNDGVLLPQYVEFLAEKGLDNLHLEYANLFMDAQAGYRLREVIQEKGLALWAWTVNDPTVFESVCDYGVDAVFTDRPDLFKKSGDTTQS